MRSRNNGGIIGSRNDTQSYSRGGVHTTDDIVITNTNPGISRSSQTQAETPRWVGADVDPYYDTVLSHFGDALYNNHILQDQSGNHWDDWTEAAYGYHPAATEFGPAYTDWSTWFWEDGFYQVKNTTDMQFGTGAFTIEAWIKPQRQNNGGNVYLFGRGGQAGVTSGTGWAVFLNSTQQVGFYDAVGNSTTTHQTILSLDTWYHIAIVRTSTATNGLQIYVNGVINGGTGTSTGNFTDSTTWWYIGRDRVGTSTTGFYGSMTEMRIVKSAVYTSNNFTIPSSPLNMTLANTVYSMSCTINNHDNIPAIQAQGKFVSRGGYGGSPASNGNGTNVSRQLDSPYNNWGATKYYGNGYHSAFAPDTNRYIMVYDTNPNKSLKFAANNFTVEAWVNYSTAGLNKAIIGKGTGNQNSGTGWTLSVDGNGSLVWWDTSTSLTSNTSINTFVQSCGWYHVAAVRSSTSANGFNMFINGVNVYSGTLATNYNQTNEMRVFSDRNSQTSFTGYVSSLRISSNARYSSNTTIGSVVFTPSIANTTIVDANTTYLICAQGNNPATQTYGSWTDRGWTRSPIRSSRSLVSQTWERSPISRFGHSWEFANGGETNRMKATSSSGAFNFGTNDFSIEFWASNKWQNRTYVEGEFLTILDTRNTFTDNGYCIRFNGAYHSLDFLANGSYINGGANGSYPVLTASNVQFGFREWVHVCVQRTNGKLALYINGRLNQETTFTQSLSPTAGFMYIGCGSYPNLQYTYGWYGWLSDIRVLNGSSAYGINGTNPEYIQLPTSNLKSVANTVLLCANSPNIVDNSGVNFVSWCRNDGDGTTAWNVFPCNYTPYSSQEFSNTSYLMGDLHDSSSGYVSSGGMHQGDSARYDLSWINRMSSPWTIECFVWPDAADVTYSSGTNARDYLKTASGGGQEGFRIVTGESASSSSPVAQYNTVKFELWTYDWTGTTRYQTLYTSNNTVLQSTCWNHIAIVYDPTQASANQMAMFVNGTRMVTSTAFTPGYKPASYYSLTANPQTSGCRISNSARYNNSNTTITIPSSTWTYDANTSVLANWEGPFIDRAGKLASIWYRPGISTTYKKFGNGSIKFMNKNFANSQQTNPYQLDFIQLQQNNYANALTDLRLGDWTIEGWTCWQDSTAGGKTFTQGNTGNIPGSVLWNFWSANGSVLLRVGIDTSGKWQLIHWGGNSGSETIYQRITSNTVVSTVTGGAKFDHVVMMRRKGNIILYVNGQEIGQISESWMGQYGSPAYPVGNWNMDIYQSSGQPYLLLGTEYYQNKDQGWCGYLQDFRWSQMARYDTRVVNGVSSMVFAGTNTPALPVISAAPHPTRGFN